MKATEVGQASSFQEKRRSKTSLLRACNLLFVGIERKFGIPGVKVSSPKKPSNDLNGLFRESYRRKILKNMDSVFPVVVIFINQATRCTKKAPITVVHSRYSALTRLAINEENSIDVKPAQRTTMRDRVAETKRFLVETFQGHCGNGLFKLKLHLLYQPTEIQEDLGS